MDRPFVSEFTDTYIIYENRMYSTMRGAFYFSPKMCMISMAERMTFEPGPKMAATPAL